MPTSTNESASPEGKYPFPENTIEGKIMRDTNNPEYMKPFLAAYNGSVEEVKKSVNKENVNNPDNDFKTVLHCASERGHLEVFEALLKIEGVQVNCSDKEGMTPLLRAAFSPNKETLFIITLLKTSGANYNAVNNLGYNALHIAINMNGGLDLIKGLVNLEVNVDERNNNDETPLHFAISKRSPELVKALLDRGADALLVDKDDKTYLHHLADFHKGKYDKIKNIMIPLIEKGVDIDAVDKEGRTALDIALENNNHNFADALKALASLNSQATNEEKVCAGAGLGTIASANHPGPKTSPSSAFSEPASESMTSNGSNKSYDHGHG